MKKIFLILPLAIFIVFATSCNSQNSSTATDSNVASGTTAGSYKNVNAKEFKDLIASGEVVLLDVRTAGEYAQGHIDGAQLLAYDRQFKNNIAKLDKSKPTLVYCRSGRRSAGAMRQLKSAGFQTVYNLGNGIIEWTRSGEKLVR